MVSWESRFDRPVHVPGGGTLETLADARAYILSLSKDRQKSTPVLAATEALLMAATKTGPLLHAQIGMIQLIHGKPDGRIEQKPKLKIEKRLSVAPSRSRE